jgi:chromosome segregation ATPase
MMETRVSLLEAEIKEIRHVHEEFRSDLKIALSGVHKMEAEVRETRKWLDDIRTDLKVVLVAVHNLEISTASQNAASHASRNEDKDILSRWVSICAILCGIASCVIAVLALRHG